MTIQIVRVGNTLTVEIPEEPMAQSELRASEPIECIPDGSGGISLVPPSIAPRSTPMEEMKLEELLESVKDGTSLGEYGWGPPRGPRFGRACCEIARSSAGLPAGSPIPVFGQVRRCNEIGIEVVALGNSVGRGVNES
jgi:antitoxin component of MazEF toxin-antitoxin module